MSKPETMHQLYSKAIEHGTRLSDITLNRALHWGMYSLFEHGDNTLLDSVVAGYSGRLATAQFVGSSQPRQFEIGAYRYGLREDPFPVIQMDDLHFGLDDQGNMRFQIESVRS